MALSQNAPRTKLAPGATALGYASQAVGNIVTSGRSADDALTRFEQYPDRAAIRAITLGTIRWYLRLAPAIDALVSRTPDPELHALLVAAAHQIEYSRNAPEPTVHVAVDAARAIGQTRGTGLVNAVLRRFVAEREALFVTLDESPEVLNAHPAWLVEAIRSAWPDHAAAVLAANNVHPPLVLRVNTSRISIDDYLAELKKADLGARAIPWMPTAVELEKPVAVTSIPGFAEGRVSIQDAGAQLAARLLDARPGMRVLDACAAPGGKTSHIFQHTPDLGELVAVDIDEGRLVRVKENLDRIGAKAQLITADMRSTDGFWDGRPFDRILVDAPCSSTGVIRRHPDIKLLRRPTDIPLMALEQREILKTAFGMLAPGGRLIYSTCSVLPAENDEVIRAFLDAEPLARSIALATDLAPGAIARENGVQLLPGTEAGTDGFHYACIEKATA